MKKKLEKTIENSTDVLQGFASILEEIKNLVSTLDIDTLLQKILSLSLAVTKSPSGSIALYNDKTETFRMRAAKGFSEKFLEIGEWKLRSGGMHEKILSGNEPYIVANTATEKSFSNPLAVKEGIKSIIVIPLTFEGKIIGMMYVDDFVERDFSDINLHLLSILSSFAAMAIDNALTHLNLKKSFSKLENANKELDRKVFEFKSLFNVANFVGSTLDLDNILQFILQSATHITKCPAGSIALYDHVENELAMQSSIGFSDNFLKEVKWKVREKGITKDILTSKEPLVVSDTNLDSRFNNPIALKENIQSMMAVPLIYQDEVVGIIYVDDFKCREFSRDEKNLFSVLSTYAAMVIKNAQLHKRTKQLAITDGLTGLYNHQFFQENLEAEITRTKRYNHYVSLLILDIDYFKKYNDTYGHVQGDNILKGLSQILNETTREIDIVARYGGEEFVIILPETEKKKALSIAERTRRSIEEFDFSIKGFPEGNRITVSIGGAVYPTNASSQVKLIERADAALYKSKDTGRNKVTFYDDIKDDE